MKSEYEVKDVTVVLFTNADEPTGPTSFRYDSKLIGAGYADGLKTETGSETWHNRVASVTITITDENEEFDGKTYGLITVTNLGGANVLKNRIHAKDLTTGYQLANLLQKEYKTNSGFIMSTHNDQYGTSTAIMDKVQLKAGVDPANAPHADVHVERLAAKIRITEKENVTDFVYALETDATSSLGAAKVRLDEVTIVNQLESGSYLLKRVTADAAADKKIPAPNATTGYDYFLANERAAMEGYGMNYVIDPWTRGKEHVTPTATNLDERDGIIMENGDDKYKLAYANDFYAPEDVDNGKYGYYSELWDGLQSSAKKLAANDAFTDDITSLDLCYTQENTTSAAMSRNGYSTGALFKATYFPEKYMAVVDKTTTTTEGVKMTQEVKAIEVDYNGDADGYGYDKISKDTKIENLNFYVYNQKIYNGYEAIFNEFAWRQQKELDGNKNNIPIYSYADFKKGKIEQIKKKEFFNHLLADFSDPLGYIDYLKKQCDANGDGILDDTITEDAVFAATDAIDAFIEANKVTLNETIKVYTDFVCYYPYWIRHANNDKFPDIGVMEFGIVRNNIYDLTVSKFKTLGLSGVDKPNPGNPDEQEKYYFNVNVRVKNWVVRKNSDIVF